MNSSTPTPAPSGPTAHRVVDALVTEGLVHAEAREHAITVVAGVLTVPGPIPDQPQEPAERPPEQQPVRSDLPGQPAGPWQPVGPRQPGGPGEPVGPGAMEAANAAPLARRPAVGSGRRHLGEALAYVGGSLVVSGVLLLVGRQWFQLGYGARVTLLVVCTLVLTVAGAGIVAKAGGRVVIREPGREIWRRLASVLLTAGAATLAGIVGVLVDTMPRDASGRVALPFAALVIAAAAAYLVVPSAAGQLSIGFGAVWCAASLASDLGGRNGPAAVGLVVLGLGAVWVALAEVQAWREVDLGRFLGCAGAFAGAQLLLLTDTPALAYTLTFLVGLGGFVLHWARRAWTYLALGVLAFTASVTEAVSDWFGGSLGVAGGLLVAGLTLIGSATLALRLRQEQAHGPTGRAGRVE